MKFEKTEFRHMAFCDEIRKFGFKICLFGGEQGAKFIYCFMNFK